MPDRSEGPDPVRGLSRLVRPYVRFARREGDPSAPLEGSGPDTQRPDVERSDVEQSDIGPPDIGPPGVRQRDVGHSEEDVADAARQGAAADPVPAERGDEVLSVFESTAGAFRPNGVSGQLPRPEIQRGAGMSKQEELGRVIYDMRRSIPELHGVMIASTDGLSIAHDFPEAEAEKIAAMAATALGLGKRITERTNLGGLHEAVIRGDYGYLVVYAAGDNAVLVLSAPVSANLGLMRIEARSSSAMVSQVLR